MTGESSSLGGAIRGEVRGALGPVVREGRVSRLEPDGRLLVSVRSLMGDAKPVPVAGWAPRVRDTGGTLELVEPQRGDRVWVAEDEGAGLGAPASGSLVCVAWEPA